MQRLIAVSPRDVEMVWPTVEHLIDGAYAEMDEITPDVKTWLINEKGQLWVLFADQRIIAAGTTSLVLGRSGLYCRCVACGGTGADWQAVITVIEQFARTEGCYKLVIDGRRGWTRALPGFEAKCFTMEKRV